LKKLLFLCIILSAIFSYTVSYAESSEISTIKVGLYYDASALESLTLESRGGFDYGIFTDSFESAGMWEETALNITATGNTLIINETLNADEQIAIYPLAEFLEINNYPYRGGVLLKAVDSKINVINIVNIEEYLYGVIGSEMPSSWNIEALKAQAVCARNFTITNINKHASLGFNVCATTNCQVYKGVFAESESVIRAVNETKGNILMYEDSLAQTLYYSSSGGHTADVKNVWGNDIPYLRGVEDPYEDPETTPRHTWSAKLSNAEIKEALEKAEIFIGDITDLKTETDTTGRVYSLTVTGTDGEYTLKNLSTASVFGSYGVLSNKYSITPYGDSQIELFLKSSNRKLSQASEYYVIDGSGEIQKINIPFSVLSSTILTKINPPSANGYLFNGGGWGHGVGMSQYGAKGMADNGFTYDVILDHYFPGTHMEIIVEPEPETPDTGDMNTDDIIEDDINTDAEQKEPEIENE